MILAKLWQKFQSQTSVTHKGIFRKKYLNSEDIILGNQSHQKQSTHLKIGEHVIVFWVDAGNQLWYLGLVDHIYEDSISVNHFVPATRLNKLTWTFPDEPDIQIVELEQVLKSNVKASYLQSTRIR